MSRWSLLIFRSHIQSLRSNHSFEPSVLSTLYILILCLLASDRFCFYREDNNGAPLGAYMFLKHFLVFSWPDVSIASFISDSQGRNTCNENQLIKIYVPYYRCKMHRQISSHLVWENDRDVMSKWTVFCNAFYHVRQGFPPNVPKWLWWQTLVRQKFCRLNKIF